MTSYSFAGEEIPLELVDILNSYISEFIEAEIPKKQYQPFLKSLLQQLAEEKTLPAKRKILRRQCQHLLNQWERAYPKTA